MDRVDPARVTRRQATRPYELGRLADDAAATGDTAATLSCCEQMVALAEQAFGEDIRLTGYLRRAADILAAVNQDAQAIEALTRTITINDR